MDQVVRRYDVDIWRGFGVEYMEKTWILAQFIVIASFSHNHPSGNLTASDADIKITNKIREALKLVEIQLLDHIIINKDEEY